MPKEKPVNDLASPLATLLAELTELPTHMGAAGGILAIIDDPHSDADDLARAVDTDPALCVKILRLANSSAYGLSRRVMSTRTAVSVIGFDTVRALAVLAASGAFAGEHGEPPDGFWGHSIATAHGAALLARNRGVKVSDAFAAGLLHDLGAMLLHRLDPALFADLDQATAEDLPGRLAQERATYGMHHGEVGAAVLDAWGFPSEMIDAQRDHHRLPVATTAEMVLLVRGGEALADLGGAPSIVELPPDAVEACTALGIGRESVMELAQQAAHEAEGTALQLMGA